MPRPGPRSIAKTLGNDFYQGSHCTKGHGTTRRTSNGACPTCESDRKKAKNAKKVCIVCGTSFVGRYRCQTCSDTCALQAKRQVRIRHYRKKYSTPEGKLELCLRQRIVKVMKRSNSRKSDSFLALTGISTAGLRRHIESQFEPGMTWENHGDWHLDHVRPCASFDLTDPEQQKKCFHYTNLQPLWREQNIAKRDHWQIA